jgi:hypothetical protein
VHPGRRDMLVAWLVIAAVAAVAAAVVALVIRAI